MNIAAGTASPGTSPGTLKEVVWLLVLATLAGLLFPLSRDIGGAQDADGILTSLISTQQLTWYFWGQNRLANLLPALAWPIDDLEWNLRFQIFLRTFASILAPIGVLLPIMRDCRGIFASTIMAGILLGFSLGDGGLYNLYVQHNPFSTSLVMFALSVAALSWSRFPPGVLLAALAAFGGYATNLALLLFTLPFLLLCATFDRKRRWFFVGVLLLQAAMAVAAYLHSQHYGDQVTSFEVNPSIEAVLMGWSVLLTQVHAGLLIAFLVAATLAALMLRTQEAFLAWTVMMGMPFAVSGMSCLTWPQMNAYDVRYYLMFVVVFVSCAGYLIVSAATRRFQITPMVQRVGGVAGLLLVFIGPLGGLSSQPGQLISERWRAQSIAASEIAAQEQVVLIAGEFWDVWPAVFAARQLLREQGHGDAPLYGAAFRGHVLRLPIAQMMRERGEVASLCFQDDVEDCIRTTNFFINSEVPVRLVPGTVRHVDLAGRTALLYRVTAQSEEKSDHASFCLRGGALDPGALRQIGKLDSGFIDNDGQSGFLMFGPYVYLPAGAYRLEVFGVTAVADGSWADVGSGSGQMEYGRAALISNTSGVLASFVVELPNAADDAEIRIWAHADDHVRIQGYRLRPVNADAKGCPMSLYADP